MWFKRQFAHVDAQFSVDEWKMLMAILRKLQESAENDVDFRMELNSNELDFVSQFFFAQ